MHRLNYENKPANDSNFCGKRKRAILTRILPSQKINTVSKALFIDIQQKEIPTNYLNRLKKIFYSLEFTNTAQLDYLSNTDDIDTICSRIEVKITREVIDAVPNLKYVGLLGTAFDGIDLAYARQKNIVVCNLGGYSTEGVAEFFFAALFEVARNLTKARQNVQAGHYKPDKFVGFELKNKTLGVIGAGRIGSRIAEIGMSLGMNVIYYDRNDKPQLNQLGATRKDLDKVLSQSDCLSLNLALNNETNLILTRKKINLMKSGCIFMNLSPSNLVDQNAVMDRASNDEIIFILYLSYDMLLYNMDSDLLKKFSRVPNCIAYPPIATRTKESARARWDVLVGNIEHFIANKPQNVVN